MDCTKWLVYPIAGYVPAIVFCEMAGIDRGTTVLLSPWVLGACAVVLGPLGFLPAFCLYFKQRMVSGSAAWRIERTSPALAAVAGIVVAAFFGLGAFGAGLYFVNLGAQHATTHAMCVTARFLGIHQSSGKRRGCRAWARILLPSGRIVRPCLTAPVWRSPSRHPQMRDEEILLIAVNENVFGLSIGAVVSNDEKTLLGPICSTAGSSGTSPSRARFW